MNNNHLVLVSGKSSSGKSASLMNMDKPEGVMYLNCENGKKLGICRFDERGPHVTFIYKIALFELQLHASLFSSSF